MCNVNNTQRSRTDFSFSCSVKHKYSCNKANAPITSSNQRTDGCHICDYALKFKVDWNKCRRHSRAVVRARGLTARRMWVGFLRPGFYPLSQAAWVLLLNYRHTLSQTWSTAFWKSASIKQLSTLMLTDGKQRRRPA